MNWRLILRKLGSLLSPREATLHVPGPCSHESDNNPNEYGSGFVPSHAPLPLAHTRLQPDEPSLAWTLDPQTARWEMHVTLGHTVHSHLSNSNRQVTDPW